MTLFTLIIANYRGLQLPWYVWVGVAFDILMVLPRLILDIIWVLS